MEENVALDTSKQKQFLKSIKGIKKLIKKTEVEVPETVVPTPKRGNKPRRKRPDRGLVYLSHIPHGFYEHEMTQYFKQFGAVSNVRVIRSKRTGNSKGCAFIEFKQPAVAEIVAETMNNYLMGKRLLKAACVPPEKQRPKAMRKHWNRLNNPGRTETLKHKKAYNENKDKAGELGRAKRILSVYKKNMKRLSDMGINYDFFSPVDIPEELGDKDTQEVKDKNISKKSSNKVQKDSKTQKKDKNNKETKKEAPAKKEVKVEQNKVNAKKVKVPELEVNKKEQKQKKKTLKEAGVEPPENFIKLQEDNDSDSSADFDSDDYNKMLENDSDVESDDENNQDSDDDEDDKESGDDVEEESDDEFQITGSDDDESEVDESEDEQIIYPAKKGKGKLGPIPPLAQVLSKKLAKQMKKKPQKSDGSEPKKQKTKQMEKTPQLKGPIAPELGKRKSSQKNVVSPKKPKFEKQTQQPMKKQFKKKK